MAQIKVQVEIDKSKYTNGFAEIKNDLRQLEANPVKIKIEATGADKASKSVIALARAEAEATKEARKLAQEIRKSAQDENTLLRAREKTIQQQERTAQLYNKFKAEQQVTARASQDLAMAQERTKQTANQAAAAQTRLQTAIADQGAAAQKTTTYNEGLVESFIRPCPFGQGEFVKDGEGLKSRKGEI